MVASLTIEPADRHAQEPTLSTVLERAGAYVARYQRQLAGVMAEEAYVQVVVSQARPFAAPRRRTLKSDVVLVRPPGADRYVLFRDVFEVDGKAVRTRQERLTGLVLESTPSTDAQVGRIMAESARFNIGDITRTVNVPTLALLVIDPAYQSRFQFTRTTERTPQTLTSQSANTDPSIPRFSVSIEMWVVEFREVVTPTLIRTTEGDDLRARGRLWLEPQTGRLRMTELIAEDRNIYGVVDVSYEIEPRFGLLVPMAMREGYASRSTRIEGSAVYSNLRRFDLRGADRRR